MAFKKGRVCFLAAAEKKGVQAMPAASMSKRLRQLFHPNWVTKWGQDTLIIIQTYHPNWMIISVSCPILPPSLDDN